MCDNTCLQIDSRVFTALCCISDDIAATSSPHPRLFLSFNLCIFTSSCLSVLSLTLLPPSPTLFLLLPVCHSIHPSISYSPSPPLKYFSSHYISSFVYASDLFPFLSFSSIDGVYSISAQCVLRVLIITEDMLGSSVTVRLQNMTQEHFLSPLLGHFLDGVSAVLSVPVEDVFIFNIQPDRDAAPGGILNVSFSATLPGGHFFPSEALEEQLYLNRPRLTSLTQMEVCLSAQTHTEAQTCFQCWSV